MSEEYLGESSPVRKKIIRKKIIKKKSGETEQIIEEIVDPGKLVMKPKVITRQISEADVKEGLNKALAQAAEKSGDGEASGDEGHPVESSGPVSSIPEGSRIVRRRVIKGKPGMKGVIKKKVLTRQLAKETVEQILGKKPVSEEFKQEELIKKDDMPERKNEEFSDVSVRDISVLNQEQAVKLSEPSDTAKEEDIESIFKPVDKEEYGEDDVLVKSDNTRIVKRRVIKGKPGIKGVIKKKVLTRQLAKETVEQILGKKSGDDGASSEPAGDSQQAIRKDIPPLKSTPVKQDVAGKVFKPSVSVTKFLVKPADKPGEPSSEQGKATSEMPKPSFAPPKVLIPDDWKEKKISYYEEKKKMKPIINPLPVDTIFTDRYKIQNLVHADRYGYIYKVTDLRDKSNKAVKEIHYYTPEYGSKEVLNERTNMLRKMISFIQDITHPACARIYDYFFDLNEKSIARCFIVMEFIDGRSAQDILNERMKDETQMPPSIIHKIIERSIDVLSYLHNKQPFPIAFGDLKLSNIIVGTDESIKFVNYGIGGIIWNSVGSFDYRGTIGYMAPEQSGMDFTNLRSDIYSFGVLFYHILTGVNPEEHPYLFRPVKDFKPLVSDKVQNFVSKCISINPDDRPTLDEIKAAIRDIKVEELDITTKETKKLEDKKKKIVATELKVVEPIEDIVPEDEEKPSFFKSTGFIVGMSAFVLIIVIVVYILFFLKH